MTESPSYSCRLWHDRGAIYVELACGLIQRYDKTEGALSKVLRLLEREQATFIRHGGANGHSAPRLPMKPKRKTPTVSVEARDKATEILKRKGVI
jgi:hypothetical protein